MVEADELLGAERVREGDVVVAMASSGAALQRVLAGAARAASRSRAGSWTATCPEFGRTLGEELLEPTRIYSLDCLALSPRREPRCTRISHITGGGVAANMARVIPAGLEARLDRGTWTPPAVFGTVGAARRRGDAGAGEDAEHGRRHGRGAAGRRRGPGAGAADARGLPSWVCGEVVDPRRGDVGGDAARRASLHGDYAG